MPPIHVVLHPTHPPAVQSLLREMPQIVLHCPADDAGVVRALDEGVQVLVTYTWRDAFLRPSLRWIAGMGAGTDQYPLARLEAQHVVLTNAAGVHSACVAEHAFGLLLALTRRIGESARNMERHQWTRLDGEELAGRKMAIIGLGRIGEEVARRAQGWDMQIVGIKRSPGRYEGSVADVRGTDQLAAACEWADIAMITAPASADGKALIGERELALLGRGWLVNVGRGSLVDEAALVAALQSGRLRGAGLDVTAVEPLASGSPLWDMPQVVISAHNAGESPGYGLRWSQLFARNLPAFAGQGDWVNLITGKAAR